MAVQVGGKAALEGDRDDLIWVLAEHELVPTVVDRGGGQRLLGKKTSAAVTLEARSDETGTVDRQTTGRDVDAVGIDSADACETVREQIEAHSAW